jgi:hypothetical protein
MGTEVSSHRCTPDQMYARSIMVRTYVKFTLLYQWVRLVSEPNRVLLTPLSRKSGIKLAYNRLRLCSNLGRYISYFRSKLSSFI